MLIAHVGEALAYDPRMPVVCLREPLKRLAGNRSELALAGRTVGELLRELEREHPATSGWLLDERGILRPHINVFVSGEPGGQETPVDAEDRVHVIPAISGG
jgi:sulfur-carrier protein